MSFENSLYILDRSPFLFKIYVCMYVCMYVCIYLSIYDRHREAETQEEGEVGSMLGARCGTLSRDSSIAPWAKGRL